MGAERGGLLGHTVQFPAKASHFVKGGGGARRGVQVHGRGIGEDISTRIVSPAADKLPGPEDFECSVGRGIKGCSQLGRDRGGISPSRGPSGDKTSDVKGKVGGGDALAPGEERASSKVAEGSQGVGARLSATTFVRRISGGLVPTRRGSTAM